MSKEIIKKPTYETKCEVCCAYFSFDTEDTTTESSGRYWAETEIVCPCCKCKTAIRDATGRLLKKVKVIYPKGK